MNDYVSKPVLPKALVEAPNMWLPPEAAAAMAKTAGKDHENRILYRLVEPLVAAQGRLGYMSELQSIFILVLPDRNAYKVK